MSFLSKRPWLLIVLLLGIFLAGWAVFLVIAYHNPPVYITP